MALTRTQKKDVVRFFVKKAWHPTNAPANQDFIALGDAAEDAYDLLVAQKATINAAFAGSFGADASLEEKAIMVAAAALKIAGIV